MFARPHKHVNPHVEYNIDYLRTILLFELNFFPTAILSKHITSALTTVKDHVIKYSENCF